MESKAVVFIDMLGFGSLTEQHDLELDRMRHADRPLSGNLDILLSRGNPLTQAFTSFHRYLKHTIDLAQMRHALTAITFSDSAFVATTHLSDAARLAVDLMKWLLPQRVPVRIGIAYGSFTALRFRSDVTVEGGDHAAQFLGTGVVRSYKAERCGIKGLRILLHPSAEQLLNNQPSPSPSTSTEAIRFVECSREERNNALHVRYEVDYWSFRQTAEAEAWHALQDMWNVAPQSEVKHYEATAAAIDRMRVRQGGQPLSSLRRRTLPRKRTEAV